MPAMALTRTMPRAHRLLPVGKHVIELDDPKDVPLPNTTGLRGYAKRNAMNVPYPGTRLCDGERVALARTTVPVQGTRTPERTPEPCQDCANKATTIKAEAS